MEFLENAEYPFIAITPRSTSQGPIDGLNRNFWHIEIALFDHFIMWRQKTDV